MASSAAAETLLESIFLVLVYSYVMFRGSKLVNEGRHALLEIFTPGFTSAMLLTLISSLPTSIVILSSGLWGSKSSVQDRIFIGMGSLAGSTVMLLTLLWGSCIIAHERNGHDVKNDVETSNGAKIMIISVLPFIIVQLLFVLESRLVILISLIASVALVISFGIYQVFFHSVQNRRLAFVHHSDVMSLDFSDTRGVGRLLSDNGEPNIESLQKLFKALDSDSDGLLSATELRALILGVQFEDIDLGISDALRNHLKEFQTLDEEYKMDMDEFVRSMSKWLVESKRSLLRFMWPTSGATAALKFKHLRLAGRRIASLNNRADGAGGSGLGTLSNRSPRIQWRDEAVITIKNPRSATTAAIFKLLCGVLIVAASAYLLVVVIDEFSDESSIPSFFISFVVTPFACYSWIWSALVLAGKKKPRILSLVFSEIYEVVTVNNIVGFAVFLAAVYARDLTWEFSSEALAALIVTVVIGLIAGFMTAFSLWTSIVSFVLYPLAVALVLILRYVLGLS